MRHMQVLEEYFEVRRRRTWQFTFRGKPGVDWAIRKSTRVARTSADRESRDILLFTIGEKKLAQQCSLSRAIAKIIERNGLKVVREETTAGNRDGVYVGFDLASESCNAQKVRGVLDEVVKAVANCSRKVGRPL